MSIKVEKRTDILDMDAFQTIIDDKNIDFYFIATIKGAYRIFALGLISPFMLICFHRYVDKYSVITTLIYIEMLISCVLIIFGGLGIRVYRHGFGRNDAEKISANSQEISKSILFKIFLPVALFNLLATVTTVVASQLLNISY